MDRPLLEQQFSTVNLVVNTTPTPLGIQTTMDMITTFIVDVPSTAANSVFMGDAGVSSTLPRGFECRAGIPRSFAVVQSRQYYELQHLLMKILKLQCGGDVDEEFLPYIVWNPTNIFLIATAATTITVGFFKTMWA